MSAQESILSAALRGERDRTYLEKRYKTFAETSVRVLEPPFPRQIQVETTNICNHACAFCEYPFMERPKQHMDQALFYRLMKEAYDLGAREVGLFAGAEPLACKALEDYVLYCHTLGFEYSYISTNGALADEARWMRLLDNGLRSIKFSVSGGTREIYHRVHGVDDFDKVIDNLRFVSSYRKRMPHKVFLGVAFVGINENVETYQTLKETVGDLVDEIMFYEASARGGGHYNYPSIPFENCDLPFNKATFTREGYLRACCNDYENHLAIEDLNKTSLKEAWHSARFQEFRKRHLEDNLQGIYCANCIRGATTKPSPLNPELSPVRTAKKTSHNRR